MVNNNLKSLPTIKQIIKQYSIKPNYKLGQNFLLDEDVPAQIVRMCGNLAGQNVIEIGPGIGSLTRELLASQAEKVIAVEFDANCLPILRQLEFFAEGRLQIIHADAMSLKLSSFDVAPVQIIANLPYNIGTQLVINWLDELQLINSITVMLQQEVANRLSAKPGSKIYGSLSVLVQWLCEVEILFTVPPEAFMPAPKVTSAVINLRPRPKPLFECERVKLEAVLRCAFNQRRKMIKSSLKAIFEDVTTVLEKIGIDTTLRPEQLSIEQFCAIAQALY